ncbi:hypothetical protein KCP76_05330 [Salmonella enterica subsp. enterica serovar Weltevreden]|nr:hypothetical protein KCP76_05330 [Salmonella enterica subsp. enterica serovar Weltevreden]
MKGALTGDVPYPPKSNPRQPPAQKCHLAKRPCFTVRHYALRRRSKFIDVIGGVRRACRLNSQWCNQLPPPSGDVFYRSGKK